MSWEMHEAAKKIADGWYSELEATRKRNAVLGRENAKLRKLAQQMYPKAKAFLQMGVQLGCNDTLSYDWYLQLRDLGVEVDE